MHNEKNVTNFIPSIASILPETNEDIYFLFCKDELLVKSENNKAIIPAIKYLKNFKLNNTQYLGSINGTNCFCGELDKDVIIPNNMYFSKLKALTHHLSEEMFWIGGRAVQIINFINNHKYCGRCGTLAENINVEIYNKCPKCGLVNYPEISPAIIVAVVREGKLLLAHNTQSALDLYSVVSGFIEVGETFEDCVVREVREETGIVVKNIKYFGNQSWPFPNSLMIGFTAEYASGKIEVDGKEIGHADWFSSNKMPLTPDSISIAKKLISWFTENY